MSVEAILTLTRKVLSSSNLLSHLGIDDMTNTLFQKYFFLILISLICTNCSYWAHYQQQAAFTQIENKISKSKLDKVKQYTSRTPYHKTYEFEFNSTDANAYALIFYISESRFPKSIVKHRYQNDLHRDAIRIDSSKSILASLNKNLPDAESVSWTLVANHITADEARDSYHILQEYIRLKIRDL